MGERDGISILKLAGEALYGARWQSPLARDLGTTDRNLRYWCAGTHSLPTDIDVKLVSLLRSRGETLHDVIAQIEQLKKQKA